MTVEIISSVAAAIAHINQHGSHHTDCIVTQSPDNALLFTQGVDSACAFVNVSTHNHFNHYSKPLSDFSFEGQHALCRRIQVSFLQLRLHNSNRFL
jgi:hypothetical protein